MNAVIDWLSTSGIAQGLTLWAFFALGGGIVFGKIGAARECNSDIERGD